MIKSLFFSNYRIFKNEQKLDLKRITVVFGKNNAGKSAILKLPVLIRSALSCKSQEVFDSSFIGLDFFEDMKGIIYGKANKTANFKMIDDSNRELSFSFFVDETKETKSKLDSWSYKGDGVNIGVRLGIDEEYHDTISNDPIHGLYFNGLKPQTSIPALSNLDCIDSFKYRVDYIGSYRSLPGAFFLQSSLSDCSGINGLKNYSHLVADAKTIKKPLLRKVSQWYEENFDGWSISINLTRTPTYSVELRHGTVTSNIVDTGVGIGQSMPIVIRTCRKCEEPTLIILEEPETHLHPAAHGALSQLIAENACEDPNKMFLIETHSINFILRLRRMIAEGVLSADDVALYYVDFCKEAASSALKRVSIKDDGSVEWWPKGVFEETLQEAIAIRKAQQK